MSIQDIDQALDRFAAELNRRYPQVTGADVTLHLDSPVVFDGMVLHGVLAMYNSQIREAPNVRLSYNIYTKGRGQTRYLDIPAFLTWEQPVVKTIGQQVLQKLADRVKALGSTPPSNPVIRWIDEWCSQDKDKT